MLKNNKASIKISIWIIFLMPVFSCADQLSIQESSMTNSTSDYYTNRDRRVQYNYDVKDKYVFLQYRRAGACYYYCGFNYDMYGLGFGSTHNIGFATMFIQAGYYIIDNSVGKTVYNEGVYYGLNARFKSFEKPMHFTGYEVKNKNTYAMTIGADIPLNSYSGVKISYQHMRLKEVTIGYVDDTRSFPALWWDPVNRDYSTINAGFYVNF